jgi:ribonuclease HI
MIVAVDAALQAADVYAGIAVCEIPSGRLLGAEIVEAQNANLAEAFAVARACQFLSARSEQGSKIWTDSHAVYRAVGKQPWSPQPPAEPWPRIIRGLQVMLRRHELILEERYRGDLKCAHNAARHAYKAFQAGREGHATWQAPNYLKQDSVEPLTRQ